MGVFSSCLKKGDDHPSKDDTKKKPQTVKALRSEIQTRRCPEVNKTEDRGSLEEKILTPRPNIDKRVQPTKRKFDQIGDDHSLVDTKENELLHPITVNGLKNENQKQALRFPQVKNTGTHGSFNEKVLIAGPFISGRIEPTQRKFHWNDDEVSYLSIETEKSDEDISVHGLSSMVWTDAEYVSEVSNISYHLAEEIIGLFEAGNTIPFISRYRKNVTGSMGPEKLRIVKTNYDCAKLIRQRAAAIIRAINNQGKLTTDIHTLVCSTKSLNDLEHIYSMFKPTPKPTPAERARELGLQSVTEAILQGKNVPDLNSFIDDIRDGLKTVQEIKIGIIHIIADIISKDKFIFKNILDLRQTTKIQIETSPGKAVQLDNVHVHDKYKLYYEFKSDQDKIQPCQILAINRGESEKYLTVKIIIPDSFRVSLRYHVLNLYSIAVYFSQIHSTLIKNGFDYSYRKSLKPAIIRRFRDEMNKKAEQASIQVFATNLRQLILAPPFKGKPVLGIDPGFSHGCKLAVVSENGDVLQTKKIYPHSSTAMYNKSAEVLASFVRIFKCTFIALGNGTACRETEKFLTDLIKAKIFVPFDVSYTIISEAGTSIYSCSDEARKEFPNLDPTLISAVSIARRLQDPLAELVKMEPKHLGVGMYQHDLPEAKLDATLNEVITEVVSFVGVDVNTSSHCLLKRIAGLNVTTAMNIIEWRKKNGPFTNREQLLEVEGIEKETYEQCAGFIRILPETALVPGYNKSKFKLPLNFLDQTWIHPEAYKIANEFLKLCKCSIENLGTEPFINSVNAYGNQGYSNLAKQLKTNEETIKMIVKGLSIRKGDDIRLHEGHKPFFRNNLTRIEDLHPGVSLTGVVRNVTDFGVYVDVGVGKDGMIYNRFMNGESLKIGQFIEAKVLNVHMEKKQLKMKLIKTL